VLPFGCTALVCWMEQQGRSLLVSQSSVVGAAVRFSRLDRLTIHEYTTLRARQPPCAEGPHQTSARGQPPPSPNGGNGQLAEPPPRHQTAATVSQRSRHRHQTAATVS